MDKTSQRHSFQGGLCGCWQCQSGQTEDGETAVNQAIEQSLLHGLFPDPILRRTLIKSVGAATLLMMTNGPAARIGDVLKIALPRPRDRLALAGDVQYAAYRQHLLTFLYR
jgi:hypothetical protein